MTGYPASIGEAESSQDTPFPNTTPVGKRRSAPIRPLAPWKRPRKLNQCLTGFFLLVDVRVLDGQIDTDYDGVCEDLENDKVNLQKAVEYNNRILPLIEDQKEKARLAVESLDHLHANAKAAGTKDLEMADQDMPDVDDSLVDKCTEAYKERDDALQTALKNNERIREMVEKLKGEFEQARAELPTHIEKVRCEYEARLSQQRKDWKEETQSLKAHFTEELNQKLKEKLDERQRFIRENAESARSHQTELDESRRAGEATADRKMKEAMDKLQLRLRNKNEELLDSHQDLRAHQRAYEKLQTNSKDVERGFKKEVLDLQNKFNKMDNLKNSYRDSLFEQYSRENTLHRSIGVLRSTLQDTVEVATMEMMQLDVARREKALLVGCLANAKSHVAELGSEVSGLEATLSIRDTRIQQLESLLRKSNRHLETERLLVEKCTSQINGLRGQASRASQQIQQLTVANSELGRQVSNKDQTLNTNSTRLRDCQDQIASLLCERTELEAQVKRHDDLLSSNETQISAYEECITALKVKESRVANELAAQRSFVIEKDQRIHELDDENKDLEAKLTQRDATIGRKIAELNANVSKIESQKERIQKLDGTTRNLEQEKTETNTAMKRLEEDLCKLRLDLGTKNHELTSQAALIVQRDARVQDLDATSTSLYLAQIKANNKIGTLETEISELARELTTKTGDLASQASAAALNNNRMQKLEVTNAGLLRSQEQAEKDTAGLENSLQNARGKIGTLEAHLDSCSTELRVANEETERTRRRLEEVEMDLSAEKESNRTASLETLLETANGKTQSLFTNLKDTRALLEEEKSKNDSLVRRVQHLEEEQIKSRDEKDISDETKSRLQVTVQNLQAEAGSTVTLLDELRSDRNALLHQLMAESTRLRYPAKKLPEDLACVVGELQDVRMFLGMQAGEAVLVRVRRFLKERKACIIIQRGDGTRILWHESLGKCTVDFLGCDWYLRLEKGTNEAPIEIYLDEVDPYDLEEWLR